MEHFVTTHISPNYNAYPYKTIFHAQIVIINGKKETIKIKK